MIVDGEKQLAPTYWRLGQALSLARKQFHYCQWDKYLKSLEFERTRAARARAIFNTFSTGQEVEVSRGGLWPTNPPAEAYREAGAVGAEGGQGVVVHLSESCP